MADDNNADDKVVTFPTTPEERRAMRKLQQDWERQRLVSVFVDEDRALFHDPNGTAYADLIIDGHRETWPVKSKEFRSFYLGYLQRQLDRLVAEGSILAMGVKAAMSKSAVNAAISDFEIRAISSTASVRTVHVRIAGHDSDIYIDLCNASLGKHPRHCRGLVDRCGPTGALPADARDVAVPVPRARRHDRGVAAVREREH
jgi:hypothetical protein